MVGDRGDRCGNGAVGGGPGLLGGLLASPGILLGGAGGRLDVDPRGVRALQRVEGTALLLRHEPGELGAGDEVGRAGRGGQQAERAEVEDLLVAARGELVEAFLGPVDLGSARRRLNPGRVNAARASAAASSAARSSSNRWKAASRCSASADRTPAGTANRASAAGPGILVPMRVELLVVSDCPNEAPAYERLRRALDDGGRSDTSITIRAITGDTLGSAPAFAGSPTVLIDGVDPFAEQAAPAASLSCRVYRSAGKVSGAPSLDELRRAVLR